MITPAEVREHYPQIAGAGEDDLLSRMIERADSLMAAHCGFPVTDDGVRTLGQATYTRYFDEPSYLDARLLDIGMRPVISVTTAHASTDWTYGSADLLAAADLVLDGQRGYLWIVPAPSAGSAWLTAARANKVVFEAGWAILPPDLVAALAMQTRHLMTLRSTQGVQSATVAGQSVTRSDADALIHPAVRAALAPYGLGSALAG